MSKSIAISTLVALGAIGLYAQQSNSGTGYGQSGNDKTMQSGGSSSLSAAQTNFVKQVNDDNLSEIKLAQLAQNNAQSQEVKNLAQTLATDHQQLQQQVQSLASQDNITLPSSPNSHEEATYNRLSKVNGAQFDREFVNMQIKDHRKDIAKFEKEASSSNPQVAQLAQQALPVLKKHLQMAEAAKAQISGGAGTSANIGNTGNMGNTGNTGNTGNPNTNPEK